MLFYPVHRNQHRESTKRKKQRNAFQAKKQDKTLEKYSDEIEVSHLPDKEFRIMVTKILNKIRKKQWMNKVRISTNRQKI